MLERIVCLFRGGEEREEQAHHSHCSLLYPLACMAKHWEKGLTNGCCNSLKAANDLGVRVCVGRLMREEAQRAKKKERGKRDLDLENRLSFWRLR